MQAAWSSGRNHLTTLLRRVCGTYHAHSGLRFMRPPLRWTEGLTQMVAPVHAQKGKRGILWAEYNPNYQAFKSALIEEAHRKLGSS